MNDLIIIEKFFKESKIDYYCGSLNGLRKMIRNCYGETVSMSSLEMLPIILKSYSFEIIEGTEYESALIVLERKIS